MDTITKPMAALFVPLLTFLFQLAQDWGLAVVLFTLLVRLLLFPLSLRVARQQVLQTKMQPALLRLRETYKDKPVALLEETRKLYEAYGVKPVAMFATAVVQMPIFMGMYALFATHGAAMTSFLLPWVLTFAQADAWHVLPLFAALLASLTSFFPLSGETTVLPVRQRASMALLTGPIFLFILWKAPVALCLYWIAGSLFGLLERAFYRTSWGKALLHGGHTIKEER